jgi:subtilisin family serine protease
MDNLLSSIYQFVDPFEPAQAGALQTIEPVRIAILDSGFDPDNPLVRDDHGQIDPRIKAAQSFVHGTEPQAIRDEIGHGTHALGLLLKVAPCADIYIGKIAHRATLNRNTYDDIAKASLAGRAEPTLLFSN